MGEGVKELMYQLKTYSALIQMKDFEIENYKKRLRKIEGKNLSRIELKILLFTKMLWINKEFRESML